MYICTHLPLSRHRSLLQLCHIVSRPKLLSWLTEWPTFWSCLDADLDLDPWGKRWTNMSARKSPVANKALHAIEQSGCVLSVEFCTCFWVHCTVERRLADCTVVRSRKVEAWTIFHSQSRWLRQRPRISVIANAERSLLSSLGSVMISCSTIHLSASVWLAPSLYLAVPQSRVVLTAYQTPDTLAPSSAVSHILTANMRNLHLTSEISKITVSSTCRNQNTWTSVFCSTTRAPCIVPRDRIGHWGIFNISSCMIQSIACQRYWVEDRWWVLAQFPR